MPTLGKLELTMKHSCGSTSIAYKGDKRMDW